MSDLFKPVCSAALAGLLLASAATAVEFPPGHVSLSAVYVDAATGNRLVVSVFDEGGGELRLTYETEDRRDLVDGVCMGPRCTNGFKRTTVRRQELRASIEAHVRQWRKDFTLPPHPAQ